LRDYGIDRQIGIEASPDEYIAELVAVFREVRRVLRDDGVLFLNLGDSYASNWPCNRRSPPRMGKDMKYKDLIGIPWMAAFALRADGWWLRRDIIWSKPNPMPESVTDRPTSAHEYVFLLTKSARYYWDAKSVREPLAESSISRLSQDIENQTGSTRANGGTKTNGAMKAVRRSDKQRGHSRRHAGFNDRWDALSKAEQMALGANCRSVWTIATSSLPEAHFATFPLALAERCILAGSASGDTVLDPFGGAGTVGLVADRLGRHATLIELNPEYCAMAERRVTKDAGLFAQVATA
jgi:DNA modification methylase